MPAHEETQERQEPEELPASPEPEAKRAEPSDEDSDEGLGAVDRPPRGCAYASLPSREAHEAFIRDALELILREAVFEVSTRARRLRTPAAPAERSNWPLVQ